jgi:integrase
MARVRQYIRYEDWPEADRGRWETAFTPGADPFDDDGAAAHLAERTRQQVQYAYGKFLFFLSLQHQALLRRLPEERVNRRIVEEFVKWQPASCGGVTLSNYIFHLGIALHYLCPGNDWSWLSAIGKRIAACVTPKRQKHHLVTSDLLYRLGIELMDCALRSGKPTTSWHVQTAYRDGLIISLLALVPLRRRTLAALRIGKNLLKFQGVWLLDISADDVKTKQPLEFPLSPELSQRINIYVDQIRSQTAGAKAHDYLWASSRGRPMGGQIIYNSIRRRTRNALGFPINLHRFRRAAATFWSVQDPANVRGARDLLGHSSFATTERYYIMAQSRLAGRALARSVPKAAGD